MRGKVVNDLINFFKEIVQYEKVGYKMKIDMEKMGVNVRDLF